MYKVEFSQAEVNDLTDALMNECIKRLAQKPRDQAGRDRMVALIHKILGGSI